MSHHFDTPTAAEDPRLNLSDLYLFRRRPGRTTMVMTVNPDAGLSSPRWLRDEAVYAFKFDLDGDLREDVSFKVLAAPIEHADDGVTHVQAVEARRAVGDGARRGRDGDPLVAGTLDGPVAESGEASLFVGSAVDPFAGNGVALETFREELFSRGTYDPAVWSMAGNLFERRNCTAIALEVPDALIGEGRVTAWATVSLEGHAPEVQVSRWGVPLFTHIFMNDPELRESYNRGEPSEDRDRWAPLVASLAEKATTAAGSVADPAGYGQALAERLCPTVLPYVVGTPATFGFAGVNGRDPVDDVMDVILSLLTNTAVPDGARPDRERLQSDFPYVGRPYGPGEQSGLVPLLAGGES